MWDNSKLQSFIRDRTDIISQYLSPRRPEPPANNPLIADRISKDQVLLREKLDAIQGNDPDDTMIGSIVQAIGLAGMIKPIPKDHPYSSQEVGDFMEFQKKLEIYFEIIKLAENRANDEQPDIPRMSVVCSHEKQDFILVMSSGNSYVRELNIDPMDNVIGRRYTPYLNYFNKATPEDIESYLMNVDFDQLRLRLINAGYSSYVEEINELLKGY
jgi:hypothetical protein